MNSGSLSLPPQSAPKHDNIRAKFPVQNPGSSAPKPAPNDDLLARMAIDTRNCISTGLNYTIDFQGNFLPIFMAIALYVGENYDSLQFKNHSKLSPPTLIAYFLSQLYIFYLLSDLQIRSSPSEWTRFMTTPEYIDLLGFFRSMPVPAFMHKFFQAAAPVADPRRPNLVYVPSFACFDLHHDFGKYFPVSIFLLAHDYVLAKKMNDPAETLFENLLNIKFYGDHYIGQLVGAHLHDGTNNYNYTSQLLQAFEGIVNPALARARSNRSVYSRINYHVQPAETHLDNTNPYRYLLPLDDDNASEFRTFLESIGSSIGDSFGSTTPMMNLIATLSGTNLLIHGTCDYAIPTHHLKANATSGNVTPATAKTYATKLKFLTNPTRATGGTWKYDADTAAHISDPMYLVADNTLAGYNTHIHPTNSQVDKFLPRSSAAPAIRVLDPYDYNATTFKQIYLSGAIIESREIDGSGVPMADHRLTLDEENSQFLQSALPLSSIFRATNFNAGQDIWVEQRVSADSGRQKATTLLYDMTENRLPGVLKDTPGPVTRIPGFTQRWIGQWWSAMSKIGFYTPTFDRDESSRLPDMSKGKVLLWSPYRYDAGKGASTSRPDRIFMLSNLRTIFGTNPPLGEVPYYLEAIPVA